MTDGMKWRTTWSITGSVLAADRSNVSSRHRKRYLLRRHRRRYIEDVPQLPTVWATKEAWRVFFYRYEAFSELQR